MLLIATEAANQQDNISWEMLFWLGKFEMVKSMYIISVLPITYQELDYTFCKSFKLCIASQLERGVDNIMEDSWKVSWDMLTWLQSIIEH